MTTETLSEYQAAIRERARLTQEIGQAEKDHAARMTELRADLAEEERLVALAEAGVSIEQFQLARQFVSIEWGGRAWNVHDREYNGPRRNNRDVQACFREAIEEFRAGPSFILHDYYGIKAYDRWDSQRTDCTYGMGPTHGSIWFRIGMPEAMRREIRDGRELTDAEKISVIGWLNAVSGNPLLLDAGVTP